MWPKLPKEAYRSFVNPASEEGYITVSGPLLAFAVFIIVSKLSNFEIFFTVMNAFRIPI